YFVADGEVEVELKHERVRLGAGHFFGEIAALRRTRRSATVTAITRTSLLVLDAHDLRVLMDREPRIFRCTAVAMSEPFPAGGAHPQCESMQQTGLAARSSRVTPPKIHSPNRLGSYRAG